MTGDFSQGQINLLMQSVGRCRTALVGVGLGVLSSICSFLRSRCSCWRFMNGSLPSRSVPTWSRCSLILVFLYACQGMLDLIRNRILARVGAYWTAWRAKSVFAQSNALAVHTQGPMSGCSRLRDMDQVRAFLGGPGPMRLVRSAWIPLYYARLFFVPLMDRVGGALGALILLSLTLATDLASRRPSQVGDRFVHREGKPCRRSCAQRGNRSGAGHGPASVATMVGS